MPVDVVIATPLEPEFAARIAAAEPRALVRYDAALLPPPRYPSDHRGAPDFRRTPEEEARFADWLAEAEVLLGLPGETPEALAAVVRDGSRLRWVQGTAAGAGEQVRLAQLTAEELARVRFTSASGVHAGQLAEWAMLGLLAFTKGLPRLRPTRRPAALTITRSGSCAGRPCSSWASARLVRRWPARPAPWACG